MRIASVTIHNYRSILDTTLLLRDYTLLVGANNAGKSNVVDAFRCFYGDVAYDRDADFPKMKGVKLSAKEAFIEVEFCDVDSSNIGEEFRSAVKRGVLTIRRTFKLDAVKKAIQSYYVAISNGQKAIGTKTARSLPGFFGKIIYVPSISKPTEELRLSGASMFRELISAVLAPSFKGNGALEELRRTVGSTVEEPLRQFQKCVNDELCNWGATFSIKAKEMEITDLAKNMLETKVSDLLTNGETDLERFGSGFQRNLVVSIIKAGAKLESEIEGGLRLLIFEEPEAFLHPDQQDELARNLRALSKNGLQVICTTHSPCFVSRKMNDMPGIARMAKEKGATKTRQLTTQVWQSIVSSGGNFPAYLNVSSKDNTSYLDSFRYALWFNGLRASVFFAKQVLLVEGATETALISRLQDDGKLNLPDGTMIIDCMGKFNYHRFMAILRGFGIPFAVVFDDDSTKTDPQERAKQQNWNKFVKAQAKLSPKAKTLALKGDVENALGVQQFSGRDDVKPYHLMHEYELGNCKNVDAFCRKVEALLATRNNN